jgi:hypothetical protein
MNMQAQLMKIRLLKKMKAPGLMKKFQSLKKMPGQPPMLRLRSKPGQLIHLLLRLRNLNKPGQLHQLCLKKFNQFHLLLLQSHHR